MIHSGHEFVLCMSGNIQYEVEGYFYNLYPGDSLLFAAQMRHRWRNSGEEKATAVIVLSGFEPGERPSEFHISSSPKMGQFDSLDEPESDLSDDLTG
jgi:mannose-6-phosphate isomerase-like protein (cupin superfamily)